MNEVTDRDRLTTTRLPTTVGMLMQITAQKKCSCAKCNCPDKRTKDPKSTQQYCKYCINHYGKGT